MRVTYSGLIILTGKASVNAGSGDCWTRRLVSGAAGAVARGAAGTAAGGVAAWAESRSVEVSDSRGRSRGFASGVSGGGVGGNFALFESSKSAVMELSVMKNK